VEDTIGLEITTYPYSFIDGEWVISPLLGLDFFSLLNSLTKI
jgi:hypothetical protein